MKRPNLPLWIFSGLIFAFLYAPIFVVAAHSFNDAPFGSVWRGFTVKWYRALFENAQAITASKNTIILAVVSTIISTVLGTMLAYGLSRYKMPAKNFLNQLLYIPVFIPDIVMAISLLLFFSLVRQWAGIFELGLATMIFAHVTFQIPFVTIVVRARLNGLDPSIEEASHDLGATNWQTFRHVTLPLILPGVMAGAMLAFTLSLDDFVVSFFTSGPGSTTLPILIYSAVKRGITPDINALSTLLVLASVLSAIMVMLFQKTKIEQVGQHAPIKFDL